jgi:uncharacterized protein VirK/YbjX
MSSSTRAISPIALPDATETVYDVIEPHKLPRGFGAIAKIASYAFALARDASLKKSVVFLGRSLIQWRKSLTWIDYIERYGRRTRLGSPPLELVRKSLGTYFIFDWPVAKTHALLVDHFEIAARVIRRETLERLWSGEVVDLVTIDGKKGTYHITLCRADQAGARHEGELTLAVTGPLLSGPLCRMTFIFVKDSATGYTIAVGSTQGTNEPDGKAAIINATRDLGGLRPKDALLLTLKGVAHRLGATNVFAVANESHVINRRRASKRRRMWTDLDSYWIDRGGVEGGPFGYILAIDDLGAKGPPANRREATKKSFWDAGHDIL